MGSLRCQLREWGCSLTSVCRASAAKSASEWRRRNCQLRREHGDQASATRSPGNRALAPGSGQGADWRTSSGLWDSVGDRRRRWALGFGFLCGAPIGLIGPAFAARLGPNGRCADSDPGRALHRCDGGQLGAGGAHADGLGDLAPGRAVPPVPARLRGGTRRLGSAERRASRVHGLGRGGGRDRPVERRALAFLPGPQRQREARGEMLGRSVKAGGRDRNH